MTGIARRTATLFRVRADQAPDRAEDQRAVRRKAPPATSPAPAAVEGGTMIMRIPGEGRYEIAEEHLAQLKEPDSALRSVADAGGEAGFPTALPALSTLPALPTAVGSPGTPDPAEVITPSYLVLPDADTSLAQVRELLSDESLIPG